MHLFKLYLSFLGLEMREIEAMSHVYNAFQMFLSLHQLVTKYQTPNITRYFCCHSNLKREERAWPLLFLNCDNNKKVRLTFAVWYWFLVTSWCNERSSTLQIEGQRNLLLFYALHNCQLTILYGFTHIWMHFSEIPPDFLWLYIRHVGRGR